jgi:putative endonuclease
VVGALVSNIDLLFYQMASVYILYSNELKRFYTGSCKDISYRIDQHLNKEFADSFTALAKDWQLYCAIDELGYKQARSIELYIKKMKSSTYIETSRDIRKLLKN